MGLIQLLIVIAVACTVWWLLTSYLPMPAPLKTIITVIFVVAVCVLLLNFAGIGDLRLNHR